MELKKLSIRFLARLSLVAAVLALGTLLNNCGKTPPPAVQATPAPAPGPAPVPVPPSNPCGSGAYRYRGQCLSASSYEMGCSIAGGYSAFGTQVCRWNIQPSQNVSSSQYSYAGQSTYFQTNTLVTPGDHVYFGFWGGQSSNSFIPTQTVYYEYNPYGSYYGSYDFSFSFDFNYKGKQVSSKHYQDNQFFFGVYFYSSYDRYWDDYKKYYLVAPSYPPIIDGTFVEGFVQTPDGLYRSQGIRPVYTRDHTPLVISQSGILAFKMKTYNWDWYYSLYLLVEHCETVLGHPIECPLY